MDVGAVVEECITYTIQDGASTNVRVAISEGSRDLIIRVTDHGSRPKAGRAWPWKASLSAHDSQYVCDRSDLCLRPLPYTCGR